MSGKTLARVIPFRPPPAPFSLEGFLRQVERRNFDRAVEILSEIFSLSENLALESLGRFLENSRMRPNLSLRLIELREALGESRIHDAMEILNEAFNIRGADALWVLQAYKQNLMKKTETQH